VMCSGGPSSLLLLSRAGPAARLLRGRLLCKQWHTGSLAAYRCAGWDVPVTQRPASQSDHSWLVMVVYGWNPVRTAGCADRSTRGAVMSLP